MLQYQNCHLPPRRGEEHLHTGFVPGKIICTSAGHWKVGRAEHQRQRAWDASEQGLGWKMSVHPKPREEIVWVYSHHTRRVGKDKPSVQGIFGLSRGLTWSRVKTFELTQLGNAPQLARGQLRQQEPELRLSSTQMKTRVCTKWFWRK